MKVGIRAVDPVRKHQLSRAEWTCLAAFAALVVLWVMLPAIPQDPAYHNFADQRSWLSVPRAADVLSNIAFALVGLWGVAALASPARERFRAATEMGLWCVTIGLMGTAIGSSWYHSDPTNATLVWDRLPITLVFAGIFGVAIAQRVGNYAGMASLAVLIPLGVASIVYWYKTGDLSLYAVLQFGGAALLLIIVATTPRNDDSFPWGWIIAFYALAKIAEGADWVIWNATHHLIAGHVLKHLFAAAASAAALWPLRSRS